MEDQVAGQSLRNLLRLFRHSGPNCEVPCPAFVVSPRIQRRSSLKPGGQAIGILFYVISPVRQKLMSINPEAFVIVFKRVTHPAITSHASTEV